MKIATLQLTFSCRRSTITFAFTAFQIKVFFRLQKSVLVIDYEQSCLSYLIPFVIISPQRGQFIKMFVNEVMAFMMVLILVLLSGKLEKGKTTRWAEKKLKSSLEAVKNNLVAHVAAEEEKVEVKLWDRISLVLKRKLLVQIFSLY